MQYTTEIQVLKASGLLREAALVGTRWVEAGKVAIEVRNPATGEIVALAPRLGEAETLEAIEQARLAQVEWAARTALQRAKILRNWFDLVTENADHLSRILTLEQGKPLAEALTEIHYGASFIEWFAEEARRIYGDVIPGHAVDKRIMALKQPVGVVGAITPWNFPNAMVTRKVAPALAAGCAIVLKPASQTPFSAIALAYLAERAGLPHGLFSVVTGSATAIGGALTASPVVRKISFTGSTEIGIELMRQSAPTMKKLSLELGGNAPFIVFDDADLDAAVEGAIVSKFRNNGQTCVCANRIYVQAGIYGRFADRLALRLRDMTVGNGLEEGTEFGPLIDEVAVAKVEEHIADALAKGGKLRLGGRRHVLGGTFFEPTVVEGANETMLLAGEETFGPIAPLFSFDTEAEVVEKANATQFGLASYVYTKDNARAWRVGEALEYGMVGINTGLISTAQAPFGGIKMSGQGREGSRYGIDDYLEIKYICVGGIDQ
ncbi:MAG: NAD-dependent succinate-semialdehyde dehydrogenase [Sphingobium sp.]|nr:MAG: NAD-dependent succinate-semialdehyde dehydrogenase [Sphingobium sp.]